MYHERPKHLISICKDTNTFKATIKLNSHRNVASPFLGVNSNVLRYDGTTKAMVDYSVAI
jgi:hypothetical protein